MDFLIAAPAKLPHVRSSSHQRKNRESARRHFLRLMLLPIATLIEQIAAIPIEETPPFRNIDYADAFVENISVLSQREILIALIVCKLVVGGGEYFQNSNYLEYFRFKVW